jgi:hypothetical protein
MCQLFSFSEFLVEAKITDLMSLYNRNRDVHFQIDFKGLSYRTKTFVFDIRSAQAKGADKIYEVRLRLLDFKHISRMRGPMEDKLRLAVESEIKINCECSDYLFGGYKYIGTQLDYAIRPENRPPDIRNPDQDGTMCKHLFFLLSNIESFEPDMVRTLNAAKDYAYLFVPPQPLPPIEN